MCNKVEIYGCEKECKLVSSREMGFNLKGLLYVFEVHWFIIWEVAAVHWKGSVCNEILDNNFFTKIIFYLHSKVKIFIWILCCSHSSIVHLLQFVNSRCIDTRHHVSPLPVWSLVLQLSLSEAWGGYQFIWAVYVAPCFNAPHPQTSKLPDLTLNFTAWWTTMC